jgi:hypothetical protein
LIFKKRMAERSKERAAAGPEQQAQHREVGSPEVSHEWADRERQASFQLPEGLIERQDRHAAHLNLQIWKRIRIKVSIHLRAEKNIGEVLSLRGVQRRSNLRWPRLGDCHGLLPSQ